MHCDCIHCLWLGPPPDDPEARAAYKLIEELEKRTKGMQTRCKFQVTKVAQMNWPGEEVTLNAVYGGSEENQSFAASTPSGTLIITVNNPKVMGQFKPGAYYYLDLIPSEA